MVAMPVLADERLGGMRSYGVMMSANAAGAVFGSLTAGAFTLNDRMLGVIMMLFAMLRGAATGLFAYIGTTGQAIAIMAAMGALMGYSSILFMTWIQRRVDMTLMGRVMSLVMLAVMGLQPLSQAFTGWFLDVAGLTPLFLGIGVFLVITGGVALFSRDIRRMGLPPDRELTQRDLGRIAAQRTEPERHVHPA